MADAYGTDRGLRRRRRSSSTFYDYRKRVKGVFEEPKSDEDDGHSLSWITDDDDNDDDDYDEEDHQNDSRSEQNGSPEENDVVECTPAERLEQKRRSFYIESDDDEEEEEEEEEVAVDAGEEEDESKASVCEDRNGNGVSVFTNRKGETVLVSSSEDGEEKPEEGDDTQQMVTRSAMKLRRLSKDEVGTRRPGPSQGAVACTTAAANKDKVKQRRRSLTALESDSEDGKTDQRVQASTSRECIEEHPNRKHCKIETVVPEKELHGRGNRECGSKSKRGVKKKMHIRGNIDRLLRARGSPALLQNMVCSQIASSSEEYDDSEEEEKDRQFVHNDDVHNDNSNDDSSDGEQTNYDEVNYIFYCACKKSEKAKEMDAIQCSNMMCRNWNHVDCNQYQVKAYDPLYFCNFCRRSPYFKDLKKALESPSNAFYMEEEDIEEDIRILWTTLDDKHTSGFKDMLLKRCQQPEFITRVALSKRNGVPLLSEAILASSEIADILLKMPYLALQQLAMKVNRDVSPLHIAIVADHVQIMKRVIHLLQNFNTGFKFNQFELCSSCIRAKAPKCLKNLIGIKQGILLKKDEEGMTLLMMAACEGSSDCLSVIFDAFKSASFASTLSQYIGWVDIKNANAVHYAALSKEGEVVHMLCECNNDADVLNAHDDSGSTPLHYAAASGNVEGIRILISKGARVDSSDRECWIPLLYAQFITNKDAVLELLKYKTGVQLTALGKLLHNPLCKDHVVKCIKVLLTSPALYRSLNDFLSKQVRMLDGPLEFLLKPGILDLSIRLDYFQYALRNYHCERCPPCSLAVTREGAWSDLYQQLLDSGHQVLCDPEMPLYMTVNFFDYIQAPVGPGVEREIFHVIRKQMTEPGRFEQAKSNQPLLVQCEGNGGITYKPRGFTNEEKVFTDVDNSAQDTLEQLKVLGWLMGYCLRNEIVLGIELCPGVLKGLLSKAATLSDILDAEEYKNMNYILSTSIDSLNLNLFFCVDVYHPVSAKMTTVEMIPNGSKLAVTDDNKKEYVDMLVDFKLNKFIACQVDAIKSGLLDVVPKKLLSLFTYSELHDLLGGMEEIDIHKWREGTAYQGFKRNSNQIIWFWSVVEKITRAEQAQLLHFATGSPQLPVMESEGGGVVFNVAKAQNDHRSLPTASTCAKTIFLPQYPSMDILEEKLLVAVRYGSEGFAFV